MIISALKFTPFFLRPYLCSVEADKPSPPGPFLTMKKILKVLAQGEPFAVQTQKAESGQLMKCNIVLQELGGKYENAYTATMLGDLACCKFYPGELVYAVLRFQVREYNGQLFQDILATELVRIKN